jgi:hypothetical protein
MLSVLTPAPAADPRPARHFSIGDGLILMAAAALSLERLRGMGWFTRFPVDLTWCWQEISRVGLLAALGHTFRRQSPGDEERHRHPPRR